MMMRCQQILFSLCVLFSLSACGFTLRGQSTFDFEFKHIQLHNFNDSQMARILKLALEIHGLETDSEKPQLTIKRISDLFDRSIVTFSATGRAQEVGLSYQLVFEVSNAQGEILIRETTLTQRREITYNDDEILGKEAEENRLYKEMQDDIAQQIVARLGALSLNNKTK